ncbi:hypothetical protein E2C01_041273 [Portunus trituberculatus]|uniref:Uncharacterized protein n=1 Tax=Portunus trituberculatus TaxID=210409 RepID=A0A5B7FT41_PORTR|nr:hypothetical protein [Portunus trituberculatus]
MHAAGFKGELLETGTERAELRLPPHQPSRRPPRPPPQGTTSIQAKLEGRTGREGGWLIM